MQENPLDWTVTREESAFTKLLLKRETFGADLAQQAILRLKDI